MKNEVNRTFTVKKNKFTNFLSCFYANTPQNTGGGNSHSSTVVTAVWKGSRPTVSRRSTDSQSQDHRNHTPISKALKYAAMLLMILTLGIGNAWGGTITWSFANSGSKVDLSKDNPHEFTGSDSSTKLYYTGASGDELAANGTYIKINGGSSVSSDVYTSRYFTFTAPSSAGTLTFECAGTAGTTLVSTGTNGTVILATVTNTANKSVTSAKLEGLTAGSTTIYIQNVSKSYFKSITWTDAEAPSYVSAYYSLVKTSMTGATLTASSATQQTGGSNLYADFANYYKTGNSTGYVNISFANPNTPIALNSNGSDCGRIKIYYGHTGAGNGFSLDVNSSTGVASYSATIAKRIYIAEYTIPDGTSSISSLKMTGSGSSGLYICAIDILTYSSGGGDDPSCEATADAGADKNTTVGVGVAMGATAAGEGYTGAWSIKAESPSTATNQLGTTSSNTMTFTPNTYGTYTLVWTVTDNNDGTCSAFDEATVTVPAPTHSIDYTNTKGAANTNPDTYTEGTGIASFAKLRHVVGYDFTGWSPSSISSSATTDQTIDAQWTANAVAKGTGSLTYALAFGSGTVTTSSITRVNGALYDATDVSVAHTSFDDNANKNGCSGKLATTESKDASKYVELTFKIADGYTFTPTEVSVRANAVSTAKTLEVELKDNAATPNSKSVTGALAAGSTDGGTTVTLEFDAAGEVVLEGTVTAKIFVYGATNAWRLGTSIVISGTVAVPATPCGATAPGDIEKGEASGGTGKITLKVEDDGEPVTGDAWYWQSAASGEAKTDEYDAENGKEVSAAGTYYLRSYNTAGDCWSAAKSVEVTAADLLTAISPTLSYDANVIVGNTLSPTLSGNAGSGAVTYALNDVTPAGSLTINPSTGVVTAVTAGGTATVTATIAANGNYAAGEATSETITVVAPATGTATISYALSGSTTTGTVTGVSTISSLSSSLTLSTLTLSGTKENYSGAIKGCTSTDALDEDDYVDVQFTVANGYAFTPSSVTVKANPFNETGALKAVVKIMDAQPLVVASNVLACEKNTDNEVTFASAAFTDKEFEGTVHIRMYFYGPAGNKPFYIKSPISITGTVATKVVKYDLSFAAGTGASGSMSTLKYAEGAEVTLPACTFTAPTGKEFDAWVVTKTVGGASVTVEDGVFTMPAEAVTATATWKDRPKHTDATLSDLTVGGETVTGFAAATTSYNVELPFGTTSAPTVAATATDASYVKSVVVTQASSATGDATVVVTAEDGTTTKTYTIHFSVETTKDLILVYKTGQSSCVGSDATVAKVSAFSQYIEKTAGTEADNSSINTTATQGGKITISAKPGYAIKAMSFYGKVEDGSCGISLDGADATTLEKDPQVKTDDCYTDVFTNAEAHSFSIINTGTHGVWVRSMKLTMIQACTPKTIAWTAEPAAEYELGSSPADIAASANNGTVSYASDDADVIAVNSSTGALTLKALGTVTLSASVPAGDGVTYCDEGAQVSKAIVKTYYLVTFDAQNETTPTPIKYYSGDDAIALPEEPTYSGFDFLGWFDASTGGNAVTSAITPTASRKIYAQWEATCDGPMITTQSGSRTYFVGREAATLVGEASAAGEGELTYTWYSCDDELRTNPVALEGAPTPSTAVAGTQYYYFTVTEAGCDVVASSDVIVITVEEKDPVCIIKATPTSGTEATADGAYKGDAYFKGRASDYKLNSGNDYVGVELASGYTFLATDKVVLNQVADLGTDDIKKFYVYSEVPADGKTYVTITNASPVKGNNWFDMPAEMVGESALYIGRKDGNCNPTVGYLAVYRTMMPKLLAITIDGRAGELDALAENTFNVMIPYESDLASLTVVPTIARNAAHATTPQAVITNDGAWVLGNNTYRVMDKDGDYTDYTIALTRDVLKYTVSYNMHGGTPAIENEMVVAGGKIAAAPADPTREDYIFQGWSLTDGGDIIDIANVTIDEDKVFHAVWASDGGIKLLDGSTVNTTNFITGVAATTVSISGDDYDCVAFGGTVNNVNASNMKNLNSHVTYNATTTQTKIRLSLYNSNGSKRTIYVKGVVEGTDNIVDLAAIELNGNEKKTTEYIEFNNAKNRSIYIFVSSNAGDIKILQVKVMEEGAALKKAGEIGYSLNMNKGRMFGAKDATIAFEGLSYTLNGDYTPLSSEVLKMKSASITFTTTVPVQLSVETKTTDKTYYITRGSAGTENPNTSSTKLNLAVPGTWYITAGSSEVQFTGVSFDYPQVEITENATDAAIIAGADVKVKDGKELTLDDAHTIHDLIVEEGGKVTLNNTLTVENLYLEAQAGASGQVLGATNVTASAVYMDVTFFKGAETLDETTASRWYMISAPFDVNLADGFYKTDGTPMVFGQTDGENIFDLFEYDGNKRATTGVTGWKRVQGKMKAGRACLIGFNPGQPTTIRLKAASTVLSEPTSITLNEYVGDEANRNWNGVANPTMHYTDLNKDVHTYNNEDGENGRKYIVYSASNTSFVVGTAFFVQATGTIDLSAASHSEFRAPQRQANERYEACVRISRSEATEFADQMYVRASENASSEYEQGHDMITWNGTTANTALIWANNYGKRLAIEEAPLVNNKATYNLGIFAPIAGEYRIETANPNDDATLYLTKNGRIFWNLTMGACELDLAQGQNNEYGLLLRAEAPAVTTGMDEIRSEAGVQKIIIDENVFILRGEQLFDMTGKLVK